MSYEINSSVETLPQLEEVLSSDMIRTVFLGTDLFREESLRERLRASGKILGFKMPRILRDERDILKRVKTYLSFLTENDRLLIRNLDELMLSNSFYWEKRPYFLTDYTVYAFNASAYKTLEEMGVLRQTAPIELSGRELEEFPEYSFEMVVYGFYPMMVSANCVINTQKGCLMKNKMSHGSANGSITQITDRKGKVLKVRAYCDYCYNEIYNALPTVLFDMERLPKSVRSLRYDFTIENRQETRDILEGKIPHDFTRGHFRKGVE